MLAISMTRLRIVSILSLITTLVRLPVCLADSSPAENAIPGQSSAAKIDFERNIVGLFGRMGCNSGSCHGSFQGRGGFRLSLFGYDAEMDYRAVTHDGFGRRANCVRPEAS